MGELTILTIDTPTLGDRSYLVHDGEVCLDALWAAGYNEYRPYLLDVGAAVPTECNFCPEQGP